MAVFYKYQYTNKRKNIHPCRHHRHHHHHLDELSRHLWDILGERSTDAQV